MYKQILKTKEEFWDVPTKLMWDLIFKNPTVEKGLIEAIEESDEYGFYLKDRDTRSKLNMMAFIRNEVESAFSATVDIESDVENWANTFFCFVWWTMDMVDWNKITVFLLAKINRNIDRLIGQEGE